MCLQSSQRCLEHHISGEWRGKDDLWCLMEETFYSILLSYSGGRNNDRIVKCIRGGKYPLYKSCDDHSPLWTTTGWCSNSTYLQLLWLSFFFFFLRFSDVGDVFGAMPKGHILHLRRQVREHKGIFCGKEERGSKKTGSKYRKSLLSDFKSQDPGMWQNGAAPGGGRN